eukprot:TRINITY_DN111821_c0_g1_i1.p1 TRINITY_DN111821_c0_g1~~TRINITY_DN111821_c0_g1_i1.p1  ORF type:complete len:315 (-),score=10.99 TRINITY_DN111821_c0_g1_i1:344-1246(-)
MAAFEHLPTIFLQVLDSISDTVDLHDACLSIALLCFIWMLGLFVALLVSLETFGSEDVRAVKKVIASNISAAILQTCLVGISFVPGLRFIWLNVVELGIIRRSVLDEKHVLERVKGLDGTAELMAEIILGYEVWCLLIHSYSGQLTFLYLFHHLGTLLIMYAALVLPINQPYVLYFGGPIHASTIPLMAVELFWSLPTYQLVYSKTYLVVRAAFAVNFILFRIVLWIPLVLLAQYDGWYLLLRRHDFVMPIDTFVLVLGSLANFGLTLLQLNWGLKVVRKIQKFFSHAAQETHDLSARNR